MEKPRVKIVEIDQAQGEAKELFEEIQRVRGKGRVSNVMRGFAISPEIGRVYWQRLKAVVEGGVLSTKLKEAVGIAQAELARCDY